MKLNRFNLIVAALLSISFVIGLGFSALTPVFPYLILALRGLLRELPELTLGPIRAHEVAIEFSVLTAAFMITRAPTAPLAGAMSDMIGRKKTMLAGMILYFITSLGFLACNDVWLLAVFRGIHGIASGLVWPVAEAYLADVTPRWSRGKILSAYVAAQGIAEIAGPAIGVGIYKLYIRFFGTADPVAALKSPIAFLALTSVISLAILAFLPEVKGGERYSNKPQKVLSRFKEIVNAFKELPRDSRIGVKVIFISGCVNGFALGIISTALIVYVIDEVVRDPVLLGMLMSIAASAAVPAVLLSGFVSDKLRRRKPLVVIGYVAGFTALYLIPLIRTYTHLLILTSLTTAIFALSEPAMRALQADLITRQVRGTIFGAQQFAFNMGIVIGALVGGYLSRIYGGVSIEFAGTVLSGYVVPLWIAASLVATTTITFILYVKEVSPEKAVDIMELLK